ncbi:MAG: hypothetical protein K6E10_04855 [Eubacterium sp.]|nr:hypothetical protein [Eubacterium sp.]
MAELSNYKCVNCGGSLQFSSQKQMLVCTSCGSEFSVAEYEAMLAQSGQAQYQERKSPSNEWDMDQEGLVVYECKNCGGEVVGDKTMGSTNCPYCDNPIVISSKFEGSLRPDLMIPFKLDKKAAQQKLKEHVDKIKLAPSAFKAGNHISEVKGVYVPFWLFDANVHAGAQYEATVVKRHSDSQYEYKETSYYDVMREGDMQFMNVPADASEKMDDALMDSIEPYDVSQAVPYSSAYMAGYLADRYDVTPEQCVERADKRMEQTAKDLLRGQVKDYTTVNERFFTINKMSAAYKYALYPVWILNTVWNGNKYVFAMNGQTGKLVGDVPYSKGKFFGVLFGVFALLWAILIGILAATSHMVSSAVIGTGVVALIIGLIVAFVMKGGTKSVHKGTKALDFVVKGSFRVTNRYDNFLRKTVDKTAKQQQN